MEQVRKTEPEEKVETLNLDLLLNAYKEEGKEEDTKSMEFLIEFSDDEVDKPIFPDIVTNREESQIPNKQNEEQNEDVPCVVNEENEGEAINTAGCILPLMMVRLQ